MGKKKIISLFFFMLSTIHTYSQELQWQEKNELTQSLYQSLENFVNEDTYVKYKLPRIDGVSFFEYFNEILTKKRREKKYAEQKKIKQKEVKFFLESHFINYDTIPELIFFDKNQIKEKGKSFGVFSSVHSEEFSVKDCNIFILMIDKGSGIRCLNIYVFKQVSNIWKLMTGTSTDIREKINIRVDNEQDKLLFETESKKIGELPFIWLSKNP